MRKQMLLGIFAPMGAFILAYFILVEDDTTSGGVCGLHHIPYAAEIVPVHYGLPSWPELTEKQLKWQEEHRAAWQVSFPYSHVANGAGGCQVRWARFARVSYCPECRKADMEWRAKHGDYPKDDTGPKVTHYNDD